MKIEAVRKDRRYTYADYCTWNDGERWELIDGIAHAMSPGPSFEHQTVSGEIFSQLHAYLRGKPCKVISAPFDVRLNADKGDDTVVQPDILIVCDRAKLESGKGVAGAPDMIIEILSPSTARHDRITKFNLYRQAGVREYWIVSPEDKSVVAHTLQDGRYWTQTYESSDSIPVQILEGCTITLSEVFE